MKSQVYFSSLKNSKMKSPLDKVKRLLTKCNIEKMFKKDNLIAIKVHFGELGNTSFIRPIFLRPVIETLKKLGAKPFLTDTNTLYIGMRYNSVDHHINAVLNGFNYSTLQAPIIIADGLRGENTTPIQVNLDLVKDVYLANDIVHSDGMVVVSHFKGHEVSSFGGAIKNISMGCASRRGKMVMHSNNIPYVKEKQCIKCGRCVLNCLVNAIEMRNKAFITDRCIGCVRCTAVCPEHAINISWNESYTNTQKKMVEYAYGLVKSLNSKLIFINILTSMSPDCDCYPGNNEPVTHDIGFLASLDPVAIDKASFDLILQQEGCDPFKKYFPKIDSKVQFEHAKKINLGNIEYDLINVE